MNLGTIFVAAAIAALLFFAVRHVLKHGACSECPGAGNCNGCPHAGACHFK